MTRNGTRAATSVTKSQLAPVGDAVDDLLGDVLDVGLERVEHAGREPAGHDAPQPGVAGVVHGDHRVEVLGRLGPGVGDADALAGAEVLGAPADLDDVGVAGHGEEAARLGLTGGVAFEHERQLGLGPQRGEGRFPLLERSGPELEVGQFDLGGVHGGSLRLTVRSVNGRSRARRRRRMDRRGLGRVRRMRPPLRFGVMYDFRNPPGSGLATHELYAQVLDQVGTLEEAGYDVVWFTEHHFVEDGYLPSWIPVAGAVLARTQRMRVATEHRPPALRPPAAPRRGPRRARQPVGRPGRDGGGDGLRPPRVRRLRDPRVAPGLPDRGGRSTSSAWPGRASRSATKGAATASRTCGSRPGRCSRAALRCGWAR